jgi:diadenosine tetraphosphate (Ap4A) HIT family hydrolase
MLQNALIGKKCPFCVLDPAYNKVIVEDDNRLFCAWQSSSPEKHTKHHFIIIPRQHVTDMLELSAIEQRAFFEIMGKLKDMFGLTSRGILIRDGDARFLGGTIAHLHIHIMVPDGTGRVESPFCKGDEADERSLAQAIVFEKVRKGTSFAGLAKQEQDLVRDIMD